MQAEDRLSEWMGRYQRGDGAVLTELYREVAPGMLNYLYRFVRDRALAEDILQEVFLRIHKVRHTYRPESPAKPWLYAIARYVAIDALRKRGRRREVPYQNGLSSNRSPDALEQTERSESMEQVERAMGGPPRRFRPDPHQRNQGLQSDHREEAASRGFVYQTQQGGRIGRLDNPGAESNPPGTLG